MCITHDIGKGQKAALTVCLTVLILLLFSRIVPAQADAASDYKVKEWGSGPQYYTVYQGKLPPMYGPNFYTDSEAVFCNLDTGKNITITFYLPYDSPSQEQAEAMYRYLLSESRAKYCWAGWYSASTMISPGNYFTQYYVYKIEGWDSTGDIDDLVNANPFQNDRGVTLQVLEVGHGDRIEDDWDYIWDILDCRIALYFPVSRPRDGATVGLRFVDADHHVVDRYSFPADS